MSKKDFYFNRAKPKGSYQISNSRLQSTTYS